MTKSHYMDPSPIVELVICTDALIDTLTENSIIRLASGLQQKMYILSQISVTMYLHVRVQFLIDKCTYCNTGLDIRNTSKRRKLYNTAVTFPVLL